MILKAERIAELLQRNKDNPDVIDPLFIIPSPDLDKLKNSGSASIDLRLGTWFVTPRHARIPHLDVGGEATQAQFTKISYVPFGSEYYLHPRRVVLGITLEWLRLPKDLAGYLVGKSSWGRCGLIIATAVGVHPGFKGCLTLEISNVGEVPIHLRPGLPVCQLFLHHVDIAGTENIDRSRFVGERRPTIEIIKINEEDRKLWEGD
jgi:dCTP deaminase